MGDTFRYDAYEENEKGEGKCQAKAKKFTLVGNSESLTGKTRRALIVPGVK